MRQPEKSGALRTKYRSPVSGSKAGCDSKRSLEIGDGAQISVVAVAWADRHRAAIGSVHRFMPALPYSSASLRLLWRAAQVLSSAHGPEVDHAVHRMPPVRTQGAA